MKNERLRAAEIFLKEGRYQDALNQLFVAINQAPENWYPNYLAGQCERFLGNLPNALEYLLEADRLRNDDESSLLLALAIVQQKLDQFKEAINTLRRSLDADPDHLPSLNTLAMTQKLMGEPDKAIHNYDLALKKIAQSVVKKMVNDRGAPIFKHQPWEELHNAWLEYAVEAAVFLGSNEGVDGIAWPSDEVASREEVTEEHGGLYWTDRHESDGKIVRLFWPNYFTSFREFFTGHWMYPDLIGNRSTVLRVLGKIDEADRLLAEAEFFANMNGR